MEFVGPALELARTGSPYLAGGTAVAMAAAVFLREVRRHYVAELAAWAERYRELHERFEKLEAKNDEHIKLWLASERELSAFMRRTRQVAEEVGGP